MYKTEQEAFWAGEFGTEYAARNQGPSAIAAATAIFAQVLRRTRNVRSVLELGANIGLNMHALRHLLPEATLHAVEINASAFSTLSKIPRVQAHNGSLLEFRPAQPVDLAFTKGVLIHISPDALSTAYDTLAAASSRYVAMIEYYNITPIEVPYRGHAGKLFKRDWCAEFLQQHPEFSLVDYGFVYHRDPMFADDDVTWFLLERTH